MTLKDLKHHPYFPFHDFESNDLSVLLVELYWAEFVKTILTDAQSSGKRLNWVPAVPADRLDGNPILQIVDRTSIPPRQFRVIQSFNVPVLPEFDLVTLAPLQYTGNAYLAFSPSLTYEALDEDGTTPMEELLIFSDISSPCERLNQQFIAKWCIERVSVSSMEQMLDGYWSLIRANLVKMDPYDLHPKPGYTSHSSLQRSNASSKPAPQWGVTASTRLLVAERHAGVGTPVIAPKTISAEPQFALAA